MHSVYCILVCRFILDLRQHAAHLGVARTAGYSATLSTVWEVARRADDAVIRELGDPIHDSEEYRSSGSEGYSSSNISVSDIHNSEEP